MTVAPVPSDPSSRHPAPEAVDAAAVRRAMDRCLAIVERHGPWLTALDTVLGDGDHGDNLVIGFRAVADHLAGLPDDSTPGELLRAVGHRLVAAVGGASGPLYGTAFLEAGVAVGDGSTLGPDDLARGFAAAAAGLARRGRCAVGDKTILDALAPGADAFEQALAAGLPVRAAAARATLAAARGMRATRPLIARRGLALRLGDRSRGHLDPGAVSCTFLLRAIGGR
ncbi:MAG: dihydroxyacetone kinase subunit DhaL [Candidatus Limnocylindria bacterium]